MIQLAGINFEKLAVPFFNCVLPKEWRESWCSIKQTWSGALEQKTTINFAKTWADPGGGGMDWVRVRWIGWLATLLQNSSPKKFTKI